MSPAPNRKNGCAGLSVPRHQVLGHESVTAISQETGVSRRTIHAGLKGLMERPPFGVPSNRKVRRPEDGRKTVTDPDPALMSDLESLVEHLTRKDPESFRDGPAKAFDDWPMS
jgi:hypothetical protein